ncbi:MAG: hypothetical protein B6D72_12395 [gamma proteobacterium symbiont of Ctena orbiculata]|nr:MAG: hypothetical protein B6D72_12395 [gamma proteobacterium symbiont of Ctena orbiculata]PVV24248.1 MAG: hypothetical protein B6D74_05930 [gamma proteobacterium symbiont of Ctena orbiculata]
MSRTPLRIMISSRNLDEIQFAGGDKKTLTELRTSLKKAIQDQLIGKGQLFDVWINEDAPSAPGDENSWEHCMEQAKAADIFICLYNGNAGWSKSGADIGICHAELETALRSARARVRLVALPDCSGGAKGADKLRNDRFQDFVQQQSLFRGGSIKKIADVEKRTLEAVRDAIIELTRRGAASSRSDKFDRGEALEWSRMSFVERKQAMEASLGSALQQRTDATSLASGITAIKLNGKTVVVRTAAVPGAMSVAEARELVGRPHLQDHLLDVHLQGRGHIGPIHLIACHRSVTETQSLKVLGFPDAVTVVSGFGVYVADNVQKAQLVFLKDCRDDTAIRHSVQLFIDWLEHSGEGAELVARADGRKKIVKAIAGLHS